MTLIPSDYPHPRRTLRNAPAAHPALVPPRPNLPPSRPGFSASGCRPQCVGTHHYHPDQMTLQYPSENPLVSLTDPRLPTRSYYTAIEVQRPTTLHEAETTSLRIAREMKHATSTDEVRPAPPRAHDPPRSPLPAHDPSPPRSCSLPSPLLIPPLALLIPPLALLTPPLALVVCLPPSPRLADRVPPSPRPADRVPPSSRPADRVPQTSSSLFVFSRGRGRASMSMSAAASMSMSSPAAKAGVVDVEE
ncbi:hypothetical protein GGF50DRAFT_118503 [Schizophyllum commune]